MIKILSFLLHKIYELTNVTMNVMGGFQKHNKNEYLIYFLVISNTPVCKFYRGNYTLFL